jgi:hypothetical protein
VRPYGPDARLASKLHALTLTGGEYQTHDYYMNIGPIFADALARQLYAEIASVESQHITHYGSMLNPEESVLEKLLLTEACEIWNYAGCLAQESNPRVKAIWEKFLDYELGHFQVALQLFKDTERRDPAEVLGDGKLPDFIKFESQREFVKQTVLSEVPLRKNGTDFVDEASEGQSSLEYRSAVNADGSPSTTVSDTYSWTPGTELTRAAVAVKAA